MKKRFFLSTSLLFLISLTSVSSCNQCRGDACRLRIMNTLETAIYTDNMNDKIYTIDFFNRDDTITLAAGQTYILDVFVNDNEFNSQYKLKESHLTKEYDSTIIQLDNYDEKSIENHLLYSFVGLNESIETTMYIEMYNTSKYGLSQTWINFCFV